MSHVVQVPPEPRRVAGGALEIHAVPAAQDNLVWLAVCTATGETAVIDGPDADATIAYCDARGLRLSAVWNTHTHGDHVGINRALIASGRLPPRVVGPRAVADQVPGLTDPVVEGDQVRLGQLVATVWETPGHLAGHVSYVFDGAVFCGDTLFAGGCGRLFDGTPAEMFRSLCRLAELPGDTLVCCAHEYTQDNLRFAWSVEAGNEALAERIRQVWAVRATGRTVVPSTIDEERATNPFLRPGSPSIRAAVGLTGYDLDLVEVFAAVRQRKDQGAYKALGDGPLPLGAS